MVDSVVNLNYQILLKTRTVQFIKQSKPNQLLFPIVKVSITKKKALNPKLKIGDQVMMMVWKKVFAKGHKKISSEIHQFIE